MPVPVPEPESAPRAGSRPEPTPASSPHAHEEHLRALGLPLFVTPRARARELLPRSAGPAAGLAVAGAALAALDRANDHAIVMLDRFEDSTDGNPADPDPAAVAELASAVEPIIELLLLALVLAVAAPLVGWLLSRLARRVTRATAAALGLGSLIALVVVPVVTLSSTDGPTVRGTVLTAALVLVGTYAGIGSLVRWSARRVRRELGTMGPMVARVLPILTLAVLFLFFSAEIWQVMVALSWPRTFALMGVMAVLTVLLVGITTRDDTRHELQQWSTDTPLRRGERANVVLVPMLATLIQAALFATLVFAFFLFLGWIAVPEATEARWTRGPGDAPDGLLFGLPFTVTLVRVALTLAAFSALNLAASAASDPAHHRRFVRPMIDEVVRGLAAREAYLGALRGAERRRQRRRQPG